MKFYTKAEISREDYNNSFDDFVENVIPYVKDVYLLFAVLDESNSIAEKHTVNIFLSSFSFYPKLDTKIETADWLTGLFVNEKGQDLIINPNFNFDTKILNAGLKTGDSVEEKLNKLTTLGRKEKIIFTLTKILNISNERISNYLELPLSIVYGTIESIEHEFDLIEVEGAKIKSVIFDRYCSEKKVESMKKKILKKIKKYFL